jgi:hypothetical protein
VPVVLIVARTQLVQIAHKSSEGLVFGGQVQLGLAFDNSELGLQKVPQCLGFVDPLEYSEHRFHRDHLESADL